MPMSWNGFFLSTSRMALFTLQQSRMWTALSLSPLDFVYTNVVGTVNLLNAAKKHWARAATLRQAQGDNTPFEGKRFYHVSTDEVYGALGDTGFFLLKKRLIILTPLFCFQSCF
jgi:nucleoside-diphosphate-sugar epimerase